MTAYQHFIAKDIAWSAWTFLVILLPGAIDFIQEEYNQSQSRGWHWWLFIIPNFLIWTLLFQLNVIRKFYVGLFEPNDLAISIENNEHRRFARNKFVESLNKAKGKKNMEAFLEAGMQMCLQSYIIARKGQGPVFQLISLFISFLTLSKACSENHITTQSMLIPTSFLQTLKTSPMFLAPCISKVLTIAVVTAFNAVFPGFGLLLLILLLVANTSVTWWILERCSNAECLMTGLSCLLTTTVMIRESSERIVQLKQVQVYAASQTLSSAISVIWLFILRSHNQQNIHITASDPKYVVSIPVYQHIQNIIIILITSHIFSALSFIVLTLLYKPGKGVVEKVHKGECPPYFLARYGQPECKDYVTTTVLSTNVSYNMPLLAVGSAGSKFPTGATLRACLDAFKGDFGDQELTFCRFDKILVLPWREDGKHHKDIWLRGRIVSTYMDQQEKSIRYGIPQEEVHREGYFPSNPVFYDLVQESPSVSWWWVKASDQVPLLPCCTPDKEQCSRNYTEGERAGVPYSCTKCGVSDLCGWCWVCCHAQHEGGAGLQRQGNYDYETPWAGKVFSCHCDCEYSGNYP